jgi:predicted dehydrogenase
MDLVFTLCGVVETMDAALATPLARVPDLLAGLHGHLTLNMRFPGHYCACVAVSDRAGAWFRGVTVLGDGGCLRINDGGFDWLAPDGRLLDSHHEERNLTAGELIGEQIKRMLGGLDTNEVPPDNARLLALCEAARLSCRTGQGEAPRKMFEMMKRV